MVDAANVLRRPSIRRAECAELQRDWIISSAESGRRAKEALTKAAEVLAQDVPGRRPDDELARAWAAVGQGWAALSHSEAARSMAVAAFPADQAGVNPYGRT